MEDLCQRIPHVCGKIFGFVDDQTLIKCMEASREINNFVNNERFFWIRIIQAHEAEGRLQDSWKKVVVKSPLAIVKEFAVSVQQYVRANYSLHDGPPYSPLYIAAGVGNSMLCEYIANRTEDEIDEGGEFYSDLHSAVMFGYPYESFKLLLENVKNKNPRNDWGETPLHHAAEEGFFEVCNLIIENVADKNPKDHQGKTPLHLAAERGYLELCRLILNGVDEKNPADMEDGETPFHKAAEFGHIEICKLFIASLDNKNPWNNWESTPLHSAAGSGHLEVCELIMKNLLDKNPGNDDDFTPLHSAALKGHLDVYKLIMSNTQDKNPTDNMGWTPLHIAAMYGHFALCKLALENVSEKNPPNNMGMTPRCMARDKGHLNVVELINSHLRNSPFIYFYEFEA